MVPEFPSHIWWSYAADRQSIASSLYHWFNLLEAAFWFVLAGIVAVRFLRNRRSLLEIVYSIALITFGLSDVLESWALTTCLIAGKGSNLAVLLWLRRFIIQKYYPQAKMI